MKKKGKTKRIITICITVIMMLGMFIVPSNAAVYQPEEDYEITAYETIEINSETQNQEIAPEVEADIQLVLQKIYKVSEINTDDEFEIETEKSILKWTLNGITYTAADVKKVETKYINGYVFTDGSENGQRRLLIGENREEGISIRTSLNQGQTYENLVNGSINYAKSENIKIIRPSFVEQTTTGMQTVLGWIALPITALLDGNWNPLLVLFVIGIAISGVLIGIKIIRKFIWGD